jgi:CRP/FNR family transcriptional regulator, cyclic AMP receptor protein
MGDRVRRTIGHGGLVSSPEFLVDPNTELDGNPDITGRLDGKEKSTLFKAAEIRSFSAGEFLFRQGEPHQGIHLIKSGEIRSLYTSSSGKEFTLAYWTPGHFVGAPQILGGGENMWSSVAEQNSMTLFLKPDVLYRLIRQMPNLALGLIDGLGYKAALYAKIAQVVGTNPISARLALLLLSLTDHGGDPTSNVLEIRGPYSQERLAMMVGSTRQAVAQVLNRFEKARMISRNDGSIRITDVAALESMVE